MDIIDPKEDAAAFAKMATVLRVDVFKLGDKGLALGKGKDRARLYLENRQYDGVYDLEVHSEREFMHHRNSGLNQVLCKIAHDKDKVVVFDVGAILGAAGRQRALLLGRMQQNVRLCRKYKVTMSLATFAKTPYQMRREEEIIVIGQLLGMTAAEAKQATQTIGRRLKSIKQQSL